MLRWAQHVTQLGETRNGETCWKAAT